MAEPLSEQSLELFDRAQRAIDRSVVSFGLQY